MFKAALQTSYMELSDGFMEQVKGINKRFWVLVVEIRKSTELMEQLMKKEVKVVKQTETGIEEKMEESKMEEDSGEEHR